MKSPVWEVALTAICAVVILAGCGSSAAAPAVHRIAHANHTVKAPAASTLVSFGQFATPLLQQSIVSAQSILATMRYPDFSTLGDACSLAGGQIASQQAVFDSEFTPAIAKSLRTTVHNSLRLAQSATDECGAASDANSKPMLKTAVADLSTSLHQLSGEESTASRWQSGLT